ncbi:hypothetical protein ABZ816_11870 [Actinosynnema sp. NPDC047251]|uniref:Uncharacterized protein n=1 Tax=Saccharothrix espanaensis (strain ATCC 51144 / DSM 44229 / JCM 9112 / NBRC 15066 / NRRL 15764) TaxID=1179773 RepID=K0KEU4_SACES|nr:hypothetical protein [Saccharothrix espanaensis]CCH35294.1 hypothetical protein BN6_80760 [Saccharothrix espanaensis DSM 44229]
MSEPDPYASPFQPVHLPGEPAAPPPGHPVDAGHPGYSGYAGYPLPMPAVDQGGLAPRRPAALTVASWTWLAGVVLVVVGLPALFFTGGDAFADQLYRDSQGGPEPYTREEARFGARLTPVLFGFGFAVLAVPFVLGALKLRSGRNWARVLLAVLAAPALLLWLVVVTGWETGDLSAYANWWAGIVWCLLLLGVLLLGVVAMFLPPANDYVRWVNRR